MPLYNPVVLSPLGATEFTGAVTFSDDNTHDIGAEAATRPKDLYLAGEAIVDGTVTANNLSANSAAVAGAIALSQIADTGAPTANTINVFAMDNGGSSTLALRCEQAVATESVVSDRTLTVYINNVALKICLKA